MAEFAADKLIQARALVKSARSIWFITGAGISADSGMPTYRGVGGLYNDELTEDHMRVEEALSASVMTTRPDITWKYLWQIGASCASVQPNAAHRAIAALEQEKDVLVLTQNVDGLHGRAGSKRVIEMHGQAFSLYCMTCGEKGSARELIDNYRSPVPLPPVCYHCGGLLRPDVVLFEESLPKKALSQFYAALQHHWDLVVVIGTSAGFPYIVEPVYEALARSIPVIEINPAKTVLSPVVNIWLPLGAAAAMMSLTCS